jgi:hypothetical protein
MGMLTIYLVGIMWNLFLSILFFVVPTIVVASLSIGYNKLKLKKPKTLPLLAFSNGVILYTWEAWISDNKKEFPIRYFITETMPHLLGRFVGKLNSAYNWVRTRTWCKYHILDIRTSDYRGGYRDADDIMLYANFKILTDFVEKELEGVFIEEIPENLPDWETQIMQKQYEKEQEIKSLYFWWTVDRFNGASKLVLGECYETEQTMLRRLVEVRPWLWT